MLHGVLGKVLGANLSAGGTIGGDLSITGDLDVSGDVAINLTSVVSNSTIIDATGTEAFLVRKDSDGGDVFVVDTTNTRVGIGTASPDSLVEIESSAVTGHALSMKNTSSNPNVRLKIDFNGNDGATQASKGYIQYNNSNSDIEINSEDSLKLMTDGTVRMMIDDNSRISLSNNDSGTSNTVFGKLAGDDLASGGNYNVFVGENAGHTNKLGDNNIAIGYGAMDLSYIDDTQDALTIQNVFIGQNAGGGDWATAA